ncbi:hypothetical protein C7H19_24245 [Aphanothece hegewaldii CCALA 016]|uniref:MotA/TolQ/ExbB proton channel domain-containing protein n=1 Tax=Aphanothece hegewaldii CCALA 016 TaxID=2107694 RepID=A0A2T1LR13_9CHRO|nr:hypothetical protein [Aphanothece hegewaldii]PSF29691.1 hypothetical protein C7H19_24245 [Aphanothece hegewaldii CCALA 016]
MVNLLSTFLSIVWQNSIFHVLTLGLLVIAICFEALSVRKYRNDYKKETKPIKEIINDLKKIKAQKHNGYSSNVTISDKDSSYINWIKEHFAGKVDEQNNFIAKMENGRFILLQYPLVLARSTPSSSLRFIPSILVALGVLGTFYGIQEGLSKISLTSVGQDSSNLLASSVQLLEGMKTAFSTSLMGLGSSSIFTIFLAYKEKDRRSDIVELRSELDKIAFLETPGRLLYHLNFEANERAATQLSETAQTLKEGFNNLIETQKQLSPQAIGSAVGQAMSPVFQEIKDELAALREIKADQGQEMLRQLIEEQREQLIKPIIAELEKSAQLTQEASGAVRELSNSLAASVDTIQHFQTQTLNELQNFASELRIIFEQFRTETQGVLENVSAELKVAVNSSIQAMDGQRNAFEISATQTAETFRLIREDLQQALQTQSEIERQMLQEFQERTVTIITTTGNEASRLMNEARENLIATLSNIDTLLQQTRVTVQQELEEFRHNYQAALQEFFYNQNQLLEGTLGEQRQGLNTVVQNLQSVFEQEIQRRQNVIKETEASLNQITNTVKVVSNLASAVGLTSVERLAQIKDITHVLGNESQRIEKAYDNLISRLNQSLEMSNQHLTNYLERAYDSERQFFTQADEATANISNRLLQAANYLVSAEYNRRNQEEI